MTFLALTMLLVVVVAFFIAMLGGDSDMGCIVPMYLLGALLCGLMVFGLVWLVLAVGCAAMFPMAS